jgi:EAL domain-containing protein (putative c-di-GMP-specific phosphodiesterase class I)
MALFEEPFIIEQHELLVTASIGISVCPDDGESAEPLLKNADIAMYHAKGRGRNNYQFYSSAANIRTFERILLENNLRRMIENGELVLHYQPQLNIDTRQICCAEALVRWQHPELGLLSPSRFLPVVEEMGLITFIDEWVLRAACTQTKAWQEAGYQSVGVTVNLSARQFQRSNLVKMISDILQETGLAPELLRLDIAETAVMQNIEFTVANLGRLADIGIGISVDKFGSGYSCLSSLMRLPAQKLKIDRSVIRALIEDPANQAIVNAVIAVAHKMNAEVVAVGVETDDQLTFLHSSGCDEMQGYLFSEPLSNDKFEKLVMTRR